MTGATACILVESVAGGRQVLQRGRLERGHILPQGMLPWAELRRDRLGRAVPVKAQFGVAGSGCQFPVASSRGLALARGASFWSNLNRSNNHMVEGTPSHLNTSGGEATPRETGLHSALADRSEVWRCVRGGRYRQACGRVRVGLISNASSADAALGPMSCSPYNAARCCSMEQP